MDTRICRSGPTEPPVHPSSWRPAMRLPSTILHPCRPAAGSFILWSLVAACGASPLVAQAPVSPALRIDNGQQQLAIEKLSIEVQVVGNLATTTWDITFPTPEPGSRRGAGLSWWGPDRLRFALPVNGVLREGSCWKRPRAGRPSRRWCGGRRASTPASSRRRKETHSAPASTPFRPWARIAWSLYEQELQPDGRSELRYPFCRWR